MLKNGFGWLGLMTLACGGAVRDGADLRGSGGTGGSGGTDGSGGVQGLGGSTNGPGGGQGFAGTKPALGYCGNGVVDPGEACDLYAPAGATCASATMGALVCGVVTCRFNCTVDTSGCRTSGAGGFAGVDAGGSGGSRASSGPGCNGAAGATMGNPHLFTPDGSAYDFQAVGEFILLEDADDPSFVVQVREGRFRNLSTASINTAIAAYIAGDRVGLYAGTETPLHLEGIPRDAGQPIRLPHGGSVEERAGVFTLAWPTGESIEVNASTKEYLNATFSPSKRGKHRRLRGLLGTPDGNPDNDFTTRNGVVLAKPIDGDRLFDVFGKSFRITAAESLFDYAVGCNTDTFTDEAFPYGPRDAAALPPEARLRALPTCVAAGVRGLEALEACVRDVALTGDVTFALGAGMQPLTTVR